MKHQRTISNVKLGIFVLAGITFLVFSLYMIGRNRNLFGTTFLISAPFRNVDGLVPGNNVRFSGINVGTVKKITILNDSVIQVTMAIDNDLGQHIRKNAVASLGTDGLVGNKIVNILPAKGRSTEIEEGTVLTSRTAIETEDMLRTLQITNNNIAVITDNLKQASVRLNGSANFWDILSDTMIISDLRSASTHLNKAGENTEHATHTARVMMNKLQNADGLVSTLFSDTLLKNNLQGSVMNIHEATGKLHASARQLDELIKQVQGGEGIGVLLADTVTTKKLSNSILNIEQGTVKFNENMEALQSNFLFRPYFKKKEKQLSSGQQP